MNFCKAFALSIVALSFVATPSYAFLDKNIIINSAEKFNENGEEGYWSKGSYIVNFDVKGRKKESNNTFLLICNPGENRTKSATLTSEDLEPSPYPDDMGLRATSTYEVEIQKGGPSSNSEKTSYQFWNHFCKK